LYPILLQLGPITIYSLWIFLGISLFVALLIINKLVKKNRLKLQFLADYSLAIFFGGIITARIFFVVRNYEYYFQNLNINGFLQLLYIWDKGLSVWGGITGIILSLLYFCRKTGENALKWLDIVSVSIVGAMSIANIGALLDGRNYGNATNLPWGVQIENSIYAVPIHPVQIYASIYCAIITLTMLRLFNHKIAKQAGNIAIVTMTSYSIFRFLEEFMRGDESNIILGLREAQIYALLATLTGCILLYARFKKKSRINEDIP
jgi:phosphatidylglycerol:prolipoprotein diacylglycerol transferase